MRLLHTSDWHLGQSLHNYDRHHEHQCFLDWLLDTIVAEQADALLVCGDVFDNANPSAASQRQLYRFLRQAKQRAPRLDVIVIAGNHDSPGRLDAPGPLLEEQGTRVVGNVPRRDDGSIDVEQLVLPLTASDGAVAAWCIAMPFLRPADVPRIGPDAGDPYLAGIALLYQQALAVAQARRQPGQSIIAMGHCHMVGGEMSNDSERRIVIGGTEMLPSGIFGADIAYAALGHLHLAQAVGKQPHIRYSGSPLPLSFSEVHYQHQVLRVDLQEGQPAQVTALAVPRAVDLLRLPEKPAPLEQVLEHLAALAPPEAPFEARPYVEVRVLLDQPQPGMRAKIEAALEGKAVRLARIDTATVRRAPSLEEATQSLEQLDKLQPDEIFKRLYRQRYDADAPAEQLAALAELMAGV
ncbi:MAG: exonuclease SbcCD subunit D C-terminal domain-containing protein [Burkholderiaceae bacterium]|nr:exonuclease SbcCD subunit D C-terminal domain-containing protein [Burkholderiaceae bacterium]